jgi:predicted Rossmann fold flavoprotein
VPLLGNDADVALFRPLSGVALPVEARCGRASFQEAMLFTHRGLSGPAILQVSSAWREGQTVMLDLLPGTDTLAALRAAKAGRPRASLRTILASLLPQRLADALAARWPAGEIANLPDRVLADAASSLGRWAVTPAGTEGYIKAEVTLGGVDTAGLSSRTMEAKAVPGLFVVGEAVDVTGWLGGYNFQWAWSSGWCAGMAA